MEGSPLNHHGQTGCSIRQGRLADKVGCFADEPTHFIAIRQTGDLQSRGTGALCVQRDGGERHFRELENILRASVDENTKAQRFSSWLLSEYSTGQVMGYSLYYGGLD